MTRPGSGGREELYRIAPLEWTRDEEMHEAYILDLRLSVWKSGEDWWYWSCNERASARPTDGGRQRTVEAAKEVAEKAYRTRLVSLALAPVRDEKEGGDGR